MGVGTPISLRDHDEGSLWTTRVSSTGDCGGGGLRVRLGGVFDELCSRQSGVFTWRQALACGLSADRVRAQVSAGRWQRLGPQVYASFTGPPPRSAVLWAAVLRAGRDAVLSHHTAAELAGLTDEAGPVVHITIPPDRRVTRRGGVVLHVSRYAQSARHPTRLPPQTRIEETVVDLTQQSKTLDEAVGWLARACGRRLTTAARLDAVLSGRSRVRWRDELSAALRDVADGSHSLLELRYARVVERAHGLPPGTRQSVRERRGGRWYDDVCYRPIAVRVELDGQAAHPAEMRFRDKRRDNAAVVAGDAVLRYGWADIAESPCAVARQVAQVLRRNGWCGRLRPCGRGCLAGGVDAPEPDVVDAFGWAEEVGGGVAEGGVVDRPFRPVHLVGEYHDVGAPVAQVLGGPASVGVTDRGFHAVLGRLEEQRVGRSGYGPDLPATVRAAGAEEEAGRNGELALPAGQRGGLPPLAVRQQVGGQWYGYDGAAR